VYRNVCPKETEQREGAKGYFYAAGGSWKLDVRGVGGEREGKKQVRLLGKRNQ